MLRRHKRKRASEAAAGTEEEDEEWDGAADLIDDTMSSIQLLLNRNTDAFAAIGLPPLVVWHQLYTILPNRTFVDQNVHRLRSEGKLVTFKIPSGPDNTAILRTEDYIAEVEKYQSSFRAQLLQFPGDNTVSSKVVALTMFGRVLPQLASLSTVPLQLLMSKMTSESSYDEQHTREMVVHIQQLGFILPTTRLDEEAYSFSLPGVGKLISAIKKTRTQILSTLKRTKYKELHEQQLKKVKLKNSVFQLEFHLADMEGCSLIRRMKVTSGVLVALVDNDTSQLIPFTRQLEDNRSSPLSSCVMALRVLSQTLRARALQSSTPAARRAASQRLAFFSTKYTPQHEYVTLNGKEGTIGITDFAQNSLGDVVYVDLPSVGDKFQKGDAFGAVESVKAASDVYTPAAGTVTAVNEDLAESPNLVNDEAMTGGWFIKLELDDVSELDELLDEAAYKEHCENEEH